MSVRSDPAVVRGVEPTPTVDAGCARVLAVLTRPMRSADNGASGARSARDCGLRSPRTAASYARRASDGSSCSVGSPPSCVAQAPGSPARLARRTPRANVAAWALAAYDAAGRTRSCPGAAGVPAASPTR